MNIKKKKNRRDRRLISHNYQKIFIGKDKEEEKKKFKKIVVKTQRKLFKSDPPTSQFFPLFKLEKGKDTKELGTSRQVTNP